MKQLCRFLHSLTGDLGYIIMVWGFGVPRWWLENDSFHFKLEGLRERLLKQGRIEDERYIYYRMYPHTRG